MHGISLLVRHPLARRREIVEANLSALQRDAQEQARPVPLGDDRTAFHFQGIDTVGGLCVALPQLRLVGARR